MATMSKADELRKELAALEAEEAHTGTIDGEGGIYLTVGGESFECRKVSTSYQMMKFADAQRKAQVNIPSGLPKDHPRYKKLMEQRNNAGMQMMAIMFETVQILLKPGERERFDTYMTEVSMDKGLDPNELENAIGDVIAAAGGEEGKAGQTTASHSSESYETTSESAQVYSFSKGGLQDKQPAEIVPTKTPRKRARN